jgi:adenylosuccinate synthase
VPAIAVIGASFGDEGKGKIVDYIAWKYDVDAVVRFNGGSGAGHEVCVDGKKFSFHQIPSAAFLGKKLYIGEGCAVDPELLLEDELKKLFLEGVFPNLSISNNSKVVFDFLREIDSAEENFRKGKTTKEVGTTKRGIGPAYAFDVGRHGLRMYDLVDEEKLRRKLPKFIELCQNYLNSLGSDYKIDVEKTVEKYVDLGKRIKPYVRDIRREINELYDYGLILFEGAQGTLLDQIFGIYPYVTSSRTTVDAIYGGTGLSPGKEIQERIGVFKAYASRVIDVGPFITKMEKEEQELLREKGDEFGRTTGRPRYIGWPNLVELKYAIERNGFTGLAITRIDTFAGIDPIYVCTKLRDEKGNETDVIPADTEKYEKYSPVYTKLKGWSNLPKEKWEEIAKKGFDALPEEVKAYIKFIQDYTKIPVKIISVGAERRSTIELGKLDIG